MAFPQPESVSAKLRHRQDQVLLSLQENAAAHSRFEPADSIRRRLPDADKALFDQAASAAINGGLHHALDLINTASASPIREAMHVGLVPIVFGHVLTAAREGNLRIAVD